jgi:hypothetical protein
MTRRLMFGVPLAMFLALMSCGGGDGEECNAFFVVNGQQSLVPFASGRFTGKGDAEAAQSCQTSNSVVAQANGAQFVCVCGVSPSQTNVAGPSGRWHD